jgi:hypothetical protein
MNNILKIDMNSWWDVKNIKWDLRMINQDGKFRCSYRRRYILNRCSFIISLIGLIILLINCREWF